MRTTRSTACHRQRSLPPLRAGRKRKGLHYFDDTVIGDVAEVQLVDKDGDIIASAGERVFTKTPGKGLYIAFKYNILEVEVESSNETL